MSLFLEVLPNHVVATLLSTSAQGWTLGVHLGWRVTLAQRLPAAWDTCKKGKNSRTLKGAGELSDLCKSSLTCRQEGGPGSSYAQRVLSSLSALTGQWCCGGGHVRKSTTHMLPMKWLRAGSEHILRLTLRHFHETWSILLTTYLETCTCVGQHV